MNIIQRTLILISPFRRPGRFRKKSDSTIETAPLLPDAFISYAREESNFVERLCEALKAENRKTWIDRHDIYPATEWQEEIDRGIETSHTFVFVLSPDSINSEQCLREVEYAVQCKKRMIPLHYCTVNPEQVVESLRKPNWIDFRKEDNFDTAFQDLLSALDVDSGYLHLSTQLLFRTKQWERRGCDSSVLLRKKELLEAQRWLKESTLKQLGPTPEQVKFITASQHNANIRRTISILSVIFVFLMIAASIFQIVQLQLQRTLQQQQFDLSRQLATQANLVLLRNQPDLALLLSVNAFQIDNSQMTRDRLFSTLVDNPHINGIWSDAITSQIIDIALHPNGLSLVSLDADGNAKRWDMLSQRQAVLFQVPNEERPLNRIIQSPDGNRLVTVSPSFLHLWDAKTGISLGVFQMNHPIEEPNAVLFSADGHRLIAATCISRTGVCNLNPNVTIQIWQWDVQTRKQLGSPLLVHTNFANATIFSPNLKFVAVNTCDDSFCHQGHILLWDVLSQQPFGQLALDQEDTSVHLAFTPDSKRLWASDHNHLQLWDVVTQKSLAKFNAPMAEISTIAFTSDGNHLAFGGCADSICQQGQIVAQDARMIPEVNIPFPFGEPFAGHIAPITHLAFTPDGSQIVSVDGSNRLSLWNVEAYDPASHLFEKGTVPISAIVADGQGNVWAEHPLFDSPVFSQDGKTLAAVEEYLNIYGSTQLMIWNVSNGTLIDTIPGVVEPVFSPDGKTLAMLSSGDNTIILRDLVKRNTVLRLVAPSTNDTNAHISHMTFSSDGKTLIAEYDNLQSEGKTLVIYWNLATGQIYHQFSVSVSIGKVSSWAFSKDWKTMAVATNKELTLWDVQTGKMFGTLLVGQTATILAMAFSPDGKTLASIDATGTTILWDVQTRIARDHIYTTQRNYKSYTLYPYSPDSSPPEANVIFSPNGSLLASAWKDTAIIWDVTSHEPFVHLSHMGGAVLSMTFSPDSGLMAWTPIDIAGVYTRELNTTSWQHIACQIAHRNLTHTEWQQLNLMEQYKEVCPGQPG